jgi:hypothetical protein
LSSRAISSSRPTSGEPIGTGAEHDRIGLGQLLKTGGDVGRLAHDGVLFDHLATTHFPRHDQAGVNAEAYAQLHAVFLAEALVEPPHVPDDAQTRVDRPLGIVFVGLGIAEVDQQPIPEVFGNMAIEAAHDLGAGFLIGADDLAQVFRVEIFREGGRADQVTEHHGELAALRIGRGGSHESGSVGSFDRRGRRCRPLLSATS